MPWNIPILLTWLRILLIPIFTALFYLPQTYISQTHVNIAAALIFALAGITDWLDADQAWVPNPGNRHSDILGGLLIDGDLRGNFVTDAHLAALAIEYGTGICSFDSDFARFDGIRWINPDRG